MGSKKMTLCLDNKLNLSEISSLVDIIRYRAQYQPQKTAYTFLVDGETEEKRLTYGELFLEAQAIANSLQSILLPGERVLLAYPSGLEFITGFFGCLLAGVVAIPVNLPKKNQKMARLTSIINNSQASLLLSTQSELDQLKRQLDRDIPFLATDSLIGKSLAEDHPTQIKAETLAFLQYTSGSTGTPKGVMVNHENLLTNLRDLDLGWEHDEKSVMVTWLPTFHDMGLIYGILLPFYRGFPCYLMSPVSFLQRPFGWLNAISKYRATHTAAPNFAYKRCLDKIKEEQLTDLDLSSWKVALNGAETVRMEILSEFARKFAPCGFEFAAFCPGYGLAEATLKVAAVRKNQVPQICWVEKAALNRHQIVFTEKSPNSQSLVSCGQTEIDTEIAIVNPETRQRCPSQQVGEIWVKGKTVAQGYWQHPEATEKTFQAVIADTGQGFYLRTGDLGFIHQGQLYITGRLKDLMIIRGGNYYPQDIEQTVEQCYPDFCPSGTAAFTVEIEAEEKLVLVQEVERTAIRRFNQQKALEAVRRAVFQEHELQVYDIAFIKPASLSKTSSGKIQRHACRQQYLNQQLPLISSPMPTLTPPLSSHQAAPTTASQEKTEQILTWLRDYAKTRINSHLIDDRRCVPPYIVMDFGNQGLMGMQIPEEYGGIALNNRNFLQVMEQLAAIDLTLATMVSLNNSLGIRPLLNYGTISLKQELLPLLATGRQLSSFGMTEPEAGANIGAISTVAVPDGRDKWRIRGLKRWNGSAWAGMINVFVRLLDSEEPGNNGLTGFLVRQGTPGLRLGPESLTMGLRGIMQNAIYFEDVLVTKEQLLGELGNGTEPADDALLYARLGIGMMGVGGMKRCLQLMLRYASRRSIATGKLLESPITLARFDHLTGATVALSSLLKCITTALDQKVAVPREMAVIAKITGADYLWEAADSLVQMLGGRGYMETNLAPQILRDARVLRIGHPGEKYSHALAWSQLQFDLCVQKALRGTPEENFASSVATIRDRILDYTQSIDDIEQRLDGSDYQLDELLTLEPEAKQTHPQAETSLVEIASQPTQNRVNIPSSPKKSLLSQQTPEKVEMWLGNWLHQKLKVNPATIQTSQSFADFGLDSIFAVELAQDLADWSGIPVEATIVWNYPTIDSLAEYLANQINQSNTGAESANTREKSEILAVLPQISEEEISAFFS